MSINECAIHCKAWMETVAIIPVDFNSAKEIYRTYVPNGSPDSSSAFDAAFEFLQKSHACEMLDETLSLWRLQYTSETNICGSARELLVMAGKGRSPNSSNKEAIRHIIDKGDLMREVIFTTWRFHINTMDTPAATQQLVFKNCCRALDIVLFSLKLALDYPVLVKDRNRTHVHLRKIDSFFSYFYNLPNTYTEISKIYNNNFYDTRFAVRTLFSALFGCLPGVLDTKYCEQIIDIIDIEMPIRLYMHRPVPKLTLKFDPFSKQDYHQFQKQRELLQRPRKCVLM